MTSLALASFGSALGKTCSRSGLWPDAVRRGDAPAALRPAKTLPLGLRGVASELPDVALPRGAVVEIAAPHALARATSFALSACATAQAEARLRGARGTAGAWCAWIDPTETLFAPTVLAAEVDPSRLLVVRPFSRVARLEAPAAEVLSRIAVRVAASRAFAVVVVDLAAVPGARQPSAERDTRWATVVRRLALSVEGCDTTVVLLSDRQRSRAMALPVAMRIELERAREDRLMLRIAKDRNGRISSPTPILLRTA